MLFHDPLFWKSLWVTSLYAIVGVPTALGFAFALALLLNEKTPGQRLFRTLFYLPSIMPTIAVSVLWLWILNPDLGLLNGLLDQIGLPHLQWLASETLVLPTLILMSLWNVGPMMIIFLAALQDVPRQLYEAVAIDGGGPWSRLRHVTIPMVTPAILFNLVIGLVGALQTFTQAYVMTDGGPNNSSLFLVFYIYREGFKESNMGYASALSWGLFAIIAVLSLLVSARPSGGSITKAAGFDGPYSRTHPRQNCARLAWKRSNLAGLRRLRRDRGRVCDAVRVAGPQFAHGCGTDLRVSAPVGSQPARVVELSRRPDRRAIRPAIWPTRCSSSCPRSSERWRRRRSPLTLSRGCDGRDET